MRTQLKARHAYAHTEPYMFDRGHKTFARVHKTDS
jgi:hypothetical protein